MPAFEMSIADLERPHPRRHDHDQLDLHLPAAGRQPAGRPRSEFLLALDDQFEKVRDILVKVVGDVSFVPEGKDWPRVWALMSVFERISIMVRGRGHHRRRHRRSRLYGYVMLRLIGNDGVFDRLKTTGAEWQDFVELCYRLARRRARSQHPHDRSFAERVHQLSKDTRTANPFSF